MFREHPRAQWYAAVFDRLGVDECSRMLPDFDLGDSKIFYRLIMLSDHKQKKPANANQTGIDATLNERYEILEAVKVVGIS